MKKFAIIITFILLLLLATGCMQKSYAEKRNLNNHYQYLREASSLKYTTAENNLINSEEQFEFKLMKFYDFDKEFFTIYNRFIETTTPLLNKFNNYNTSMEDKIICSQILRENYVRFREDIKQINPPAEASNAHQYILSAISKRILFFKEFEKGVSQEKLTQLEEQSYHYENLFWDEINKIYDYYLEEIVNKNNIII